MKPRLRHDVLYALLLAVAAAAWFAYKVTRTPEWTILTGSEEQRQDVCRSVYKKAAWRASWALDRLLADPSPAVRVPAIGALARRPDLHERFASRIRELAESGDRSVDARALEYLLQHDVAGPGAYLDRARRDLEDASCRDQHPGLLSSYLAAELDRGNPNPVAWALDLLEDGAIEDPRPLQTLLRYPELLRPFRARLVDGRSIALGSIVLGANYDWYTTGPLDPNDPACLRLRQKKDLQPEDVETGWHPYPAAGYDRYRRLDIEMAYGQLHNKVIFLYTEIEVGRAGDYLSFLTLDDNGYVFIDGQRVAGRDEPGVGEGWMMVDKCRLKQGRYPVFAWVHQADVAEPSGPDAGRHSPNHWVFKWLLRESRYRPAPQIRGLPVRLRQR